MGTPWVHRIKGGACREGIVPLGQSTLSQMKNVWVHQDLSDVIRSLYGCRNKTVEENESKGKHWSAFP